MSICELLMRMNMWYHQLEHLISPVRTCEVPFAFRLEHINCSSSTGYVILFVIISIWYRTNDTLVMRDDNGVVIESLSFVDCQWVRNSTVTKNRRTILLLMDIRQILISFTQQYTKKRLFVKDYFIGLQKNHCIIWYAASLFICIQLLLNTFE